MEVPRIPSEMLDTICFRPSEEWEAWARGAFIQGDGPQINPDHAHLSQAMIGFVLSSVQNEEKGKRVLGTCQDGKPSGKPWPSGQRRQQIVEWFGIIPDFLIILDAVFLSTAEPIEACALVEHELYHAGMQKTQFGEPKYDRDSGRPMFAVVPHDVEEFTGIVRRYGAWNADLEAFSTALAKEPEFGRVKLNGICGCGASL